MKNIFDIEEIKEEVAVKKIKKRSKEKTPEWYQKLKEEKRSVAQHLERQELLEDN